MIKQRSQTRILACTQDEPDVSIRKAAALAAARILSRSAQEDASKPLRQLVGRFRCVPAICSMHSSSPVRKALWCIGSQMLG
jgi:hypothetical protein